jgi:hypothetical protein
MEEIMKMYAMQGGMEGMPAYPVEYTLTVNTASALTARMIELCESDAEKAELLAAQVYRLCLLSQRRLTAEELKSFLSGSFDLLGRF